MPDQMPWGIIANAARSSRLAQLAFRKKRETKRERQRERQRERERHTHKDGKIMRASEDVKPLTD